MNWLVTTLLRHSPEVTDGVHIAHHLAGTTLSPHGLIVTGIKIHFVCVFNLKGRIQSFQMTVLFCDSQTDVCVLLAGVESARPTETRLEKSRRRRRYGLSVHHLCGAGSEVDCEP